MADAISYTLIAVTTFCFGLIVSFQLTHIQYCRKLTGLLRRSINSKSLAPVLAELEEQKEKA
jgi:uncharacterized membrane protein